MNLSISNIAWPIEKESAYLSLIKGMGVDTIEVAPSKIWKEPVEVSKADRRSYKKSINKAGITICAIQSLLFTRGDLKIFGTKEGNHQTQQYLQSLCYVASDLGAKVLVYGSPKSRMRNEIEMDVAMSRAAEFFEPVAAIARDLGVIFCIEPLGKTETDFINTLDEGNQLVKLINSSGFKLHIDSKAFSEEGVELASVLPAILPNVKHFHISEPELLEINSSGRVKHLSYAKALKTSDYQHYVSIEMKTLPNFDSAIKNSILEAKKIYV